MGGVPCVGGIPCGCGIMCGWGTMWVGDHVGGVPCGCGIMCGWGTMWVGDHVGGASCVGGVPCGCNTSSYLEELLSSIVSRWAVAPPSPAFLVEQCLVPHLRPHVGAATTQRSTTGPPAGLASRDDTSAGPTPCPRPPRGTTY